MTGEKYTFETARLRLEEIALEVRKKDTSLEKSLDLLEEGVRLANVCTELVDHTEVSPIHSIVSGEHGAPEDDTVATQDVPLLESATEVGAEDAQGAVPGGAHGESAASASGPADGARGV